MKVIRQSGNCLLLALFTLGDHAHSIFGFSTPRGESSPPYTLFDRFKADCPADRLSIEDYDPSFSEELIDSGTWVAIFRSSNNKPSVFVRDEFLNAMKLATGAVPSADSTVNPIELERKREMRPVAVARLSQSVKGDSWMLDTMRCSLEKEKTDKACEGGSEYTEALSVAIDTLLIHHLKTVAKDDPSAYAIRARATLFSSRLLEDRGFQPIDTFAIDRATHTSSMDASMERFANKFVEHASTNYPGARDRAQEVLSLLGTLDRNVVQPKEENNSGNDEDETDPWASMRKFI